MGSIREPWVAYPLDPPSLKNPGGFCRFPEKPGGPGGLNQSLNPKPLTLNPVVAGGFNESLQPCRSRLHRGVRASVQGLRFLSFRV